MKNLFHLLFFLPILLIQCSDPVDPCEDVTCFNNGYCRNGACVCPDGFTGADCSKEITPDRITIKRISVTRFPATKPDGGGWDLLDGADLLIVLYDENEAVLWESNFYEDANTSNVYDYFPDISISDANSKYIVRVFDYDYFDSNDFMGGIIFPGYLKNLRFPLQYTIDAGENVAFEFEVKYYW